MLWISIAVGLFSLGLAAHGVRTGTVQVRGGVERARFPKTFWFVCAVFAAIGCYFLWIAWYDFVR